MDVSTCPSEDLEAELVAHAAWEATGMAHMLEVLAEFDRRRVWDTWCCTSPQQWLGWKCGLGYTAASERLRVARTLGALPYIQASFSRGKISWSKVRERTRVATADTDQCLGEIAEAATAAHVATLVRAMRRRTPKDAIAQIESRGFAWHTDDDGSMVITLKLPTDQGMAIVKAVEAAATPQKGVPMHQRRADAIVELLTSDDERPAVPRLVVHIEQDKTSIEGGASLCPEIAEMLACGGSITTLMHTVNGPVVLKRDPPPSRVQRRWLARRHATCQFPGCHHAGAFHTHHVQNRHLGGKTKLWNLTRLCGFHHRLVHLFHLQLTLHPDRTLDVCFPDGKPVDRTIEFSPYIAPAPANPDWISSDWTGEKLNLNYALIAIDSHTRTAA